eukprot:s2264_g1.t1
MNRGGCEHFPCLAACQGSMMGYGGNSPTGGDTPGTGRKHSSMPDGVIEENVEPEREQEQEQEQEQEKEKEKEQEQEEEEKEEEEEEQEEE